MRISVEVSLYPLDRDYFLPIEHFLDELRKHPGLSLKTNGMSTQIFGEYDKVMGALQQEMKRAMEGEPRVVFVAKFLNGDVSQFKERLHGV